MGTVGWGLKVEGLKELQTALRVSHTETGKAVREAGRVAGEALLVKARPRVPVRSGALRASLGVRVGARSASVKAGTGVRVPYAAAIHFGVGPRPGRRGPHNIPAVPYLWSAGEEMNRSGELERIYGVAMASALRASGFTVEGY